MDQLDALPLPEDLLATVISLAVEGPRAASRAATVSPAFRAAADSDAVWCRFFPPDLAPLDAAASTTTAAAPLSKKELFLRLSGTHALVADGLTSAWLDRESGAKSYMVAARAMTIIWSNEPQYWRWIPHPDSRFPECAELLAVCWLDIRGYITSAMLSGDTQYAAYLVFKMADYFYGLDSPLQVASITVGESTTSRRSVRLQSYVDHENDDGAGAEEEEAPQLPRERADGWMELEIGEWYNHGGDDGTVCASIKETRMGGNWKKGVIVQGLEIRPKNI